VTAWPGVNGLPLTVMTVPVGLPEMLLAVKVRAKPAAFGFSPANQSPT